MARSSTITAQQIAQIYDLRNKDKSPRVIAKELNLSYSQVRTALDKQNLSTQQAKTVALVQEPVVQQTTKSVFDIIEQLEECLKEINDLRGKDGPLKDRVAVQSEKRMLVAEARNTLEKHI